MKPERPLRLLPNAEAGEEPVLVQLVGKRPVEFIPKTPVLFEQNLPPAVCIRGGLPPLPKRVLLPLRFLPNEVYLENGPPTG